MQVHRLDMANDCYAVFIGRVSGVYDHSPYAQAQVDRYPGASHRGFDSRAEAEKSYLRWMLRQETERNRCLKKYYIVALLLMLIALLFYVMV